MILTCDSPSYDNYVNKQVNLTMLSTKLLSLSYQFILAVILKEHPLGHTGIGTIADE